MDNQELPEAYLLSLRLLEHKSYQELTHQLIIILLEWPGIIDVAAYEIFMLTRDVNKPDDYSARRFPLSLDDCTKDENQGLLTFAIQCSHSGLYSHHMDGDEYLIFDIRENVKPPRLLIIKGNVSDDQLTLLTGLLQVYERLVILLDSKERDNLTHLHNRQTMDIILNQVFEYYQRNDANIDEKHSWVALLDIDHFKDVNDTFGHLYGDEVLIMFSNLMEKTFRYSDFIFRYGGEEFIVIINRLSKADVVMVLERFRKVVEEHGFSFGSITVSIGYTFVNPKVSQRVLLEYADSALYAAKKNGRNRIEYNDQTSYESNGVDDVELF